MALLDANRPDMRAPSPTQFQTLAVVSLVLALICLMWSLVDPRMVDVTPVWMKPLKFSLSFAVLFLTVALVEGRLSEKVRTGWLLRIIGWVMAAAFLSEMAYIIFQGARAEPSHFNLSTPFNAFMYSVVMAAGAVALVAAVGLIGWIVKRDRDADLPPSMREAIWLGFALSFVLTMIVAGYLSGAGRYPAGLHPGGAPVLPLLGWSGVTGDLRTAHFLSLHAMQALPLLALVLGRGRSGGAVKTIMVAALVYCGATLGVFALAVAGLPLIPMT